MSCPGLHCPGCSGGQTAGIAATTVVGLVVAGETVQWVAGRMVWISATMAVCFILAVAAGMWLERLADRRGARFAAAHGILSRADVILPHPVQLTAVSATAPRPAIGAPQITVNIFGVPSPEQAAVIRQALPEYTITSDAGGMMAFDTNRPNVAPVHNVREPGRYGTLRRP
jgi:hypothetical protein